MANTYSDYFNVNEGYFPCFDESAINNGAKWDDTYPHSTFVELINATEKMLEVQRIVLFGFMELMVLVNQNVHMR